MTHLFRIHVNVKLRWERKFAFINNSPNTVQFTTCTLTNHPFGPPLFPFPLSPLPLSSAYHLHHHHHNNQNPRMDTEANWHRITASLLREIERLQTELALATQHNAPAPEHPARANDDADQDEDEEYEPTETESEMYWTDREYVTDDDLDSGSEAAEVNTQDKPPAPVDAIDVSPNDPVNSATGGVTTETDSDAGADYAPSETASALYWTDKEFITDDAWETDSDRVDGAIEVYRDDMFATPAPGEGTGGSPACDTMALHRSLGTPSRFVPREGGGRRLLALRGGRSGRRGVERSGAWL